MEEKLQVRKGIALQLKEHDSKTNKFRSLNRKIKKKEELTKDEIVEFNDMTKNTKLEKALQTNERVIDALIREKIEDPMYYDVFVARCRDIGEPITVEKAKYFKEEVLMLNKGNPAVINCCSMKLGINAITSLCKHAKNRKVRLCSLSSWTRSTSRTTPSPTAACMQSKDCSPATAASR